LREIFRDDRFRAGTAKTVSDTYRRPAVMIHKLIPGLGAVALAFAGATHAATLNNPGLESGSASFIETVPQGSGANGWSVVYANIEFVRTGYSGAGDIVQSAHEGEWFVDLNGTQGPGGLRQSLLTDPNQQYRIGFWMSGNPGPLGSTSGGGPKTLDVLWNGAVVGSFSYTHLPGDRWNNLRWEAHSVLVNGVGLSGGFDTLEIRSTSNFYAAAGPFVDALSITAVPEPGTWAMLAAGLGLLGVVGARRGKS
jgi:hypothetical protein